MALGVSDNDIKALFFEDIMSQLSKMGYGDNWMVYAYGGSINSDRGVCTLKCSKMSISGWITPHGMKWVSPDLLRPKFESFDIRSPNCHTDIIEWVKNNYDS